MSHITKVGLRIRNLDALEEAASHCNLELRRDQKTHIWYGRFMDDSEQGRAYAREFGVNAMGTCEHALRRKNHQNGDYEIGLVPAKDGDGYELALDTFCQQRLLTDVGGEHMDKLRREYAAATALLAAKKKLAHKGFTAKRVDNGNRIQIVLTHR